MNFFKKAKLASFASCVEIAVKDHFTPTGRAEWVRLKGELDRRDTGLFLGFAMLCRDELVQQPNWNTLTDTAKHIAVAGYMVQKIREFLGEDVSAKV